jgi:hypothetical protein
MRMTSSVGEAYIRALVANHFRDWSKAKLWFETPNPQLGNVSPNKMIELGRTEKLKEFIESSLGGYGV